jgi:hypothetical protein
MLETLSAADSAAGHYVLEGVRETGSELLLKPDGTFEFMLAYGAMDLDAQGSWRQDGDSVILNAKVSGEPLFRQSKTAVSEKPGIHVKVVGPAGEPAQNIDVTVNAEGGWVHARTGGDGIAEFAAAHNAKSVAFRIAVYDATMGPLPLDPTRNEFEYVLNGDAITQVPFKDEHLKFDGKGLDLLYFDKAHSFHYRKE